MNNKIRIIAIIFFCLYSAFFFIGSILAPITAFIKQYDFSALLTSLYMYSCHQQPDRSFWLLGYPIALCCRCLGFYIGVFIFGTIDLFSKLKINLKIFAILSIVSFIDIYINYGLAQKYNTGNLVRFIIGIIMGLLFVSTLSYLLNKKWRIKKYEN